MNTLNHIIQEAKEIVCSHPYTPNLTLFLTQQDYDRLQDLYQRFSPAPFETFWGAEVSIDVDDCVSVGTFQVVDLEGAVYKGELLWT